MRQAKSLSGLLAIAIATSACGGAAPDEPSVPVLSAVPASPATPLSSAPTATPSSSTQPSDGPSAEPTDLVGEVLEISAKSHEFDKTELTAPADEAFHIVFANNELLISHNVEILDNSGTRLFFGKVFDGVATMTYDVPALPAGTYPFRCTVHPEMTGTLNVE